MPGLFGVLVRRQAREAHDDLHSATPAERAPQRPKQMNMREKMARAMTAIQSSCGRELTCRGAEPCSCTMDVLDAALDALTANPGEDVLAVGADTMPLYPSESGAGNTFTAMIRAIKEGK